MNNIPMMYAKEAEPIMQTVIRALNTMIPFKEG